ncbi:hypothetical protein GF319_08205 [Candidatus Bathyarchaeota archaeon]|nr:hypothetical protein [Candidatus Bathyarchaeota archaeon]
MSEANHVTRSIRISEDLDDVLRSEAEAGGVSVNNIITELVEAYSYNGRFFGNTDLLTVPPSLISSLLEGLSEEQVLSAGENAGRLNVRSNLLSRGMTLDYESLKWFITDILSKYNGWFHCNFHEMKNFYMFHLRHGLHRNWSLFIHAYLEAMVKDIMGIEVDAEVLDGTVTLRIPVKMT